jgi:hypothetical protein
MKLEAAQQIRIRLPLRIAQPPASFPPVAYGDTHQATSNRQEAAK